MRPRFSTASPGRRTISAHRGLSQSHFRSVLVRIAVAGATTIRTETAKVLPRYRAAHSSTGGGRVMGRTSTDGMAFGAAARARRSPGHVAGPVRTAVRTGRDDDPAVQHRGPDRAVHVQRQRRRTVRRRRHGHWHCAHRCRLGCAAAVDGSRHPQPRRIDHRRRARRTAGARRPRHARRRGPAGAARRVDARNEHLGERWRPPAAGDSLQRAHGPHRCPGARRRRMARGAARPAGRCRAAGVVQWRGEQRREHGRRERRRRPLRQRVCRDPRRGPSC